MKISEFFKTHDWCQKASARDADGLPVDPYSDLAVAWCLFGAICKLKLDMALLYERENRSWVSYNDIPGMSKEILIAELEKFGC